MEENEELEVAVADRDDEDVVVSRSESVLHDYQFCALPDEPLI